VVVSQTLLLPRSSTNATAGSTHFAGAVGTTIPWRDLVLNNPDAEEGSIVRALLRFKNAALASAAFDEMEPPGCATFGALAARSASPCLSQLLATIVAGATVAPSERLDLIDGAPPAG
jgi:hypothetical protein